MGKAWNGCAVICGGNNGCGSMDNKQLEDENHHLEDYETFECLNCGRILKIELPN